MTAGDSVCQWAACWVCWRAVWKASKTAACWVCLWVGDSVLRLGVRLVGWRVDWLAP